MATLDDATVFLNRDGNLTGRLSVAGSSGIMKPASNVAVNLTSLTGLELSARSGANGVFEFEALSPGLYVMRAHGEDGGLSAAIRVVRRYDNVEDGGVFSEPTTASDSIQLHIAMASSEDLQAIDEVIAGVEVIRDDSEYLPEHMSPDQQEFHDTDPGHYLTHGKVTLSADGALYGYVVQLSAGASGPVVIEDLTVSFVQEGRIMAATEVKPSGEFVQENLLPGLYSMVVAGTDGVGYLGVDVVRASEFAVVRNSAPSREVIPTSLRMQQGLPMIGIIRGTTGGPSAFGSADGSSSTANNPANSPEAQADAGAEAGADAPLGPGAGLAGGGGFTGGGSGGGLGGGTGFAELLGLTGAALGAANLASDDDSPSRPASPGR